MHGTEHDFCALAPWHPGAPPPRPPPPCRCPAQSEAKLEQLDAYPEEPEVHKYLQQRMMAFDLETLYELHYLSITLGKVFCQKRRPNCEQCPLQDQCDYAKHGGARLLVRAGESARAHAVGRGG